MSRIIWDKAGEHGFEAGIDRGVFYSPHDTVDVSGEDYPKGFAWNGLTKVDIKFDGIGAMPLYLEARKTIDLFSPGELSGTLSAFTYPKEFEEFDGLGEATPGFLIDGQDRDSFGLSYRSLLGNDEKGIDLGYKIHILYNLVAVPDTRTNQTLANEVAPAEFAWTITGVSEELSGFRPSSHFVLLSTKLDASKLIEVEDILYGTSSTEPRLPKPSEVLALVSP